MKHALDAIYKNGQFRPIQREELALSEGQRVRITVDDESEPEALRLAAAVYEGLSADDDIEEAAFQRGGSMADGRRLQRADARD